MTRPCISQTRPQTRSLLGKKVFWKLTDETGAVPDGLIVDAKGYLWIARAASSGFPLKGKK